MQDTTSSFTIKDGDIFRWSYKDEQPGDRNAYARYHCKSMIAVAKNGHLTDTFWSSPCDGACWSYEDALLKLTLVHLGNFEDLEKQRDYMRKYYEESDFVDLNHSNSSKGNFYIRRGAKRSANRMKEAINQKIKEEMATIKASQWHIESLEKSLAELCAGKPLEDIYL